MERQLNFVNNLNNRVRKRYYIDDNSEFDLVPQEENNQVYSINDNQLFQMEVANEEEEISGNIVSFMGRQKTKIEKLQVSIQPVQNLNGYDNPWPAGGGKNIAHDVTYLSPSNQYGRVISASYSIISGKRYVFSFTTPNTGERVYRQAPTILGFSSLSGFGFTCDGERKSFYGTASSDTTITNKPIVSKQDNDSIAVGLCSEFMIEEVEDTVTTPSDYAPYSNICPITGWNSVTVNRTGVNVWDEKWEVGDIDNNTGRNKNSTSVIRSKNYTAVKPSTPYYFHIGGENQNNWKSRFYDADMAYIGTGGTLQNNAVFTTPSNAAYVRFALQTDYGTTYNNDISINYPATDTEYHAYQGNTYTIQLGETVYGGTLDVTSGTLTVDRVGITPTIDLLQSINTYGIANFRFSLSDASTKVADQAKAICSALKYQKTLIADTTEPGFILSTASGGYLRIPQEIANTIETAQSWVSTNNVIVVYYLATPFELTLTPEQISTLQGTNNVWSDVGPITLKYSTKGLTTYLLKP